MCFFNHTDNNIFCVFGLRWICHTNHQKLNYEQGINKPPRVLHRKDRGQDCEMLCLAVRKACETMQVPLPLWSPWCRHVHVAWFFSRDKLPSLNGTASGYFSKLEDQMEAPPGSLGLIFPHFPASQIGISNPTSLRGNWKARDCCYPNSSCSPVPAGYMPSSHLYHPFD